MHISPINTTYFKGNVVVDKKAIAKEIEKMPEEIRESMSGNVETLENRLKALTPPSHNYELSLSYKETKAPLSWMEYCNYSTFTDDNGRRIRYNGTWKNKNGDLKNGETTLTVRKTDGNNTKTYTNERTVEKQYPQGYLENSNEAICFRKANHRYDGEEVWNKIFRPITVDILDDCGQNPYDYI